MKLTWLAAAAAFLIAAGCGSPRTTPDDQGPDGADGRDGRDAGDDADASENQRPWLELDRNEDGSCHFFFKGELIVPFRKPKFATGAELNFVVWDHESDPVDIFVEYSRDNGVRWLPARIQPCTRSKKDYCLYFNVGTRPPSDDPAIDGRGDAISWAVWDDLGPLGTQGGPPVQLRVTVSDAGGPGATETCEDVVIPARPGDVHRFVQLEQPTFVTMARKGYTGFLAIVPSDEELTKLSGLDGEPGTYDDLLLPLPFFTPLPVLYPAVDATNVHAVAMTPLGAAALFLRVPTVQINGGGGDRGFLWRQGQRSLPGQKGFSPIWNIPTMEQLAGADATAGERQLAAHFFENGRRYVADLSTEFVTLEPDRDGDRLPDAAVRADGTRIERCVDPDPFTGQVRTPCLTTRPPPVIEPPPGWTPKTETDPAACLASLPTFAQMAARGYNAIVVDIVQSVDRRVRLAGRDGANTPDDLLLISNALRDVNRTNPDPQFETGIVYWYPGTTDPCADGVGRAPDGRMALYVTVPEEDKNNLGSVVTDPSSGAIIGGGYLESNVARPLPGEIGYSPLFNVPATWEELRDVTRGAFGCTLADHYWSGATVYLDRDTLDRGTKGPDDDGDGCADSITVDGKTLTR